MESKIRVGLTMRVDCPKEYNEPRDVISQDWINLITRLNFIPILIPNSLSLSNIELEHLNFNALILTNGGESNISPAGLMNEECNARDFTESLVFNYALSKELPIMGVCRGMQFIYRFYGGTIENLNSKSHVNRINKIDLDDGNRRAVRCFHDLGCSSGEIPDELKVWARSADDEIEGIKHISKKILAMQWHPEREHPSSAEDFLLIKDFFKRNK